MKAESSTFTFESMVKVNRWLWTLLFAVMTTLGACTSSDDDDGTDDSAPKETEYEEIEVALIEPNFIYTSQSETVTITGSGFGTDASLVTVKFGDETATITQIENETIICEAPIFNEDVTVNVVVKMKDGRSYQVRNGFTYIGESSVYMTGVEPDLGSTDGGTEIKITGGNLTSDTKVSFRYRSNGESKDLELVCEAANSEGTQIECTTPSHSPEEFVDIVLNDSEWIREDGFGYYNPPAIESMEVVEEDSEGFYEVTIYGANFLAERASGTTVSLDSTVIDCGSVSDTQIVCSGVSGEQGESFQITVEVEGIGDVTESFEFPENDVVEPPVVYAPEVNSLSITEGAVSGDPITLSGEHLSDVKVYFDGTEAECSSIEETQVECVTPAHAPGEVTVKVENDHGSDESQQFTYKEPTISSFSPTTAPTTGGTDVTIYGSYFGIDPDALEVWIGDGFQGTDISINEDGSITFKTGKASTGSESVYVLVFYGDGSSDRSYTYKSGFEYDESLNPIVPQVDSLTPSEGAVFGSEVTITGSNLDAATVKFGDEEAECSGSETELVCEAPGHAPEEVTVTVSNDNGSDTSKTFTYKAVEVTSFSPTSGSIDGGETITIYGNYFGTDPEALWVFIGSTRVTDIAIGSDGSLTGTTGSRETGGSSPVYVFVTYNNESGTSWDAASDKFTYEGDSTEPKSKYDPEITDLEPASGVASGGRQFVIKGKNFRKKFKVKMNGRSITFKCKRNRSTKITCKTGRLSSYENEPVSVEVIVENVVNKTKYESNTFSYTYDNTPEINETSGLTKHNKKTGVSSIKSGSKIDIHGINFSRSSETKVYFTKEGSSRGKKGSHCTVNSQGTKITCKVPSFGSKKDVDVKVTVQNKFKRSFEATTSNEVNLTIKH